VGRIDAGAGPASLSRFANAWNVPAGELRDGHVGGHSVAGTKERDMADARLKICDQIARTLGAGAAISFVEGRGQTGGFIG
ncbi:MAG: hypothetical protein AAFZ05_13385, partial [Pseudomonadota bacterium]